MRVTPIIKLIVTAYFSPQLHGTGSKFRENAGMVLDDDAVSAAVDAWSDIPQMPDLAGAIRRTLVIGGD